MYLFLSCVGSLLFIGIFDFTSTFGLILYLFLTGKLFEERFDHVCAQLSEIAFDDKPLDLKVIDRLVHRFNVIIDDLQKCNYFWSKFNFLNYHYGLILCSVLLLVCRLHILCTIDYCRYLRCHTI